MRLFSTLTPLIATVCINACSGNGASRAKDGAGAAGGADGILIDRGPDGGVPDTIPPAVGPDADLTVRPSDILTGGAGGSAGVLNTIIDGGQVGSGGTLNGTGSTIASSFVPYRYSLHYVKDTVDAQVSGTALFQFSATDNCELLDATFKSDTQDFVGAPPADSSNFCQPFVTLLLSGGLFDGVTVHLRNLSSDPMETGYWQFNADCSGQGIDTCSGQLERID